MPPQNTVKSPAKHSIISIPPPTISVLLRYLLNTNEISI